MSILVLVLLGLVQGLCEFLPISSSGHLVLLSKLFKVEDSLFVSIILHVATLLAYGRYAKGNLLLPASSIFKTIYDDCGFDHYYLHSRNCAYAIYYCFL